MATTDTQKPTVTTPAVENPPKPMDPPAPDLPVDPPTETPAATAPPENGSKADSEDPKTAPAAEDGAAPAASVIEKKMRRAERFGISAQLTEEVKRNSRAERFGTVPTSQGSDGSKKSEELKRKARAERFGIVAPPVASDEDGRKKARLARFAPASKTTAKPDPQEEEKRKARSLRFSNGSAASLTQVNDKGNIESKAAIASGAVGNA